MNVVSSSNRTGIASEAWTLMLEFFFAKARPRMLEIWREFDLMPPQQMVIGLLTEPKPMGELAQHMHCDSSNITGIVDRLEERGLVERRAAEGDRRIKLVALTESGEETRAELERRRSVPPSELEALSPAELKKLRQIFSKISA
jgi:MarR family transcriptional regulator, organic hydroperoxide resistance regulator